MKRFIILICGLFMLIGCSKHKPAKLLPIVGERKLNEKGDTIYHSIGNFTLTNQFGEQVTEQTIKNKIYIADFFFCTCQSICPKMSTQLKRVQDSILKDTSVLILSHSVNPKQDTIEVLKTYGEKYGAIKNKWHLLTADTKIINSLAKYDYLVPVEEGEDIKNLFVHSELFILVDRNKYIRGFYDGTDSLQVNKMLSDIKLLKKEE